MPYNPLFVNGGKSSNDALERPGTANSSHRSRPASPEKKITASPIEELADKPMLSKCKFYTTFILTVVALSSFSALLFLVPFIVDPALATLTSDFIESPVECQVVHSKYTLGASNCSWSSCREGCTRDIFECHQILIEYTPLPEDHSVVMLQQKKNAETSSKIKAALFVNIKGCGYPPTVQCASWIGEYGANESTIPCYYSRSNSSVAITHLDTENDWRDLLLSVFVPLISCIVSAVGLCIMHTDCCSFMGKTKDGSKEQSVDDSVWKKPDILAPNSPISIRRKSLRQRSAHTAKRKAKLMKSLSFKKCSESVKRKADLFEVPTFSKKLKTENWDPASSRENLILESWKRDIAHSSSAL